MVRATGITSGRERLTRARDASDRELFLEGELSLAQLEAGTPESTLRPQHEHQEILCGDRLDEEGEVLCGDDELAQRTERGVLRVPDRLANERGVLGRDDVDVDRRVASAGTRDGNAVDPHDE